MAGEEFAAELIEQNMNTTRFLKCLLTCAVALGAGNLLRAEEAPAAPAAPEKKPIREELKLTPEERQARLKERREKQQKMTPEQREAQRKVWRERMDKKVEDLKKKKADGTITPQEEKQVERVQDMIRRGEPSAKPAAPPEPK